MFKVMIDVQRCRKVGSNHLNFYATEIKTKRPAILRTQEKQIYVQLLSSEIFECFLLINNNCKRDISEFLFESFQIVF